MSWNHRLVRDKDYPGIVKIREVFYDKNNDPWSYGSAEAYHSDDWLGDAAASIREQLDGMVAATREPILQYPDDFTGNAPVVER